MSRRGADGYWGGFGSEAVRSSANFASLYIGRAGDREGRLMT